jgi:hypothetical protein
MTDTYSTYCFIFCIKDIYVKKQNCVDKPNMLKDNDYFVRKTCFEVEFLEEIQTEVLRVFLLAIHRHLY